MRSTRGEFPGSLRQLIKRVRAVFLQGMKSAYELAMERLAKSDPSANRPLDPAKKAKLAEIDRVYQGKLAEREIFLKQQLESARVDAKADEFEKIQKQITSERARLEEEREDEKERVRRG